MATSGGKVFTFHTLQFTNADKNFQLSVRSLDDKDLLSGNLGLSFSTSCGFVCNIKDDVLELEWAANGKVVIKHTSAKPTQHRYDLEWQSYKPKELKDAYELRGAHWYGAAQIFKQKWPIEKWDMKLMPFIAGNSFKDSEFGGVQERYFLSSNGVALFVNEHVPLFVGINGSNNGLLTLVSKYDSPYYNPNKLQPYLHYSIFQDENLRAVHDFVAQERIPKPIDCPDELLFRHPIWSTWATYKKDINQQVVLQFAEEIQKRGFSASQLEIDDDWTPRYGDMVFDKAKFPDPHRMMKDLKDKGYRVTLWVHPFASPRSQALSRGDFWLSSTFGFTTWWNGVGKCLDVTNPSAIAWYKGCLQLLMDEYGIDSYKFDAGEVSWLPSGISPHTPMITPNDYPKKYAEMCYSIDKNLRAQEVRVGVRTQHLPVLVRMMDKLSCWGYDNGLKSLIPHALTFSVIGYHFILPDMVGGNAYSGLPDRDLYVRWMEANALLPCIQISIPPWQYDDEVVAISHKMLKLHESYADLITCLAREAKETGAPIIRPLWWIAPNDEIAQVLDSEFLLGDDILVAPVLDAKMTSRSIYLPAGKWKCQITGEELDGGRWHDNYEAKFEDLPHFSRIHADS